MKKLISLIFLLCSSAWAQTALTTTTFTFAVAGGLGNAGSTGQAQTQVALASLTNVLTPLPGASTPRTVLFVDREMMSVQAINAATNTVFVNRGFNGTLASPHTTTAVVYVGTPDQFFTYDPGGACFATLTRVTPWINASNGNQWTCLNGVWTFSGGPLFVVGFASGGNGLVLGQTGQGTPSLLQIFGGVTPTSGAAIKGGDNVFAFPTWLTFSPLSSGILCATQTANTGECPAGEILGKGPQSVSTAAVTIGAAATDTQVAELVVDSGFLNQANRVVTVHFGGNYTTIAAQTPTITVKVKLCTVSGCGSGTVLTLGTWGPSAATTASSTNSFGGRADIGTVSTGATGTVILKDSAVFVVTGATGGTTPTFFTDTNTAASSSIALTGQLFLDLVWQYSTGTTNTVTTSTFRVN